MSELPLEDYSSDLGRLRSQLLMPFWLTCRYTYSSREASKSIDRIWTDLIS